MFDNETKSKMCTTNFNIILNYYFSLWKISSNNNLKKYIKIVFEVYMLCNFRQRRQVLLQKPVAAASSRLYNIRDRF